MDTSSLERELRLFLCDELGLDAEMLDSREGLLSTGMIDSADLVRLATFVEGWGEIEVPDRDISASHFDSIAKIIAYVKARCGGEQD